MLQCHDHHVCVEAEETVVEDASRTYPITLPWELPGTGHRDGAFGLWSMPGVAQILRQRTD